MICFATVAVIADISAKKCKSYWLPTDIVARNKNPGSGTKGTREPKKLTRAKIRYPSSGANGKISPNSTNQTIFTLYLIKSRKGNLQFIKISSF
jgi:hypothetical protein